MPDGKVVIMNSKITNVAGNHVRYYNHSQPVQMNNTGNVSGAEINWNVYDNHTPSNPGACYHMSGAKNGAMIHMANHNPMDGAFGGHSTQQATAPGQRVFRNGNMTIITPPGGIVAMSDTTRALFDALLEETFATCNCNWDKGTQDGPKGSKRN